MRPGYLSGYGEDSTKPGNQGEDTILDDIEVGYIPEHIQYSKIFPNLPFIQRPIVQLRDPRTFNVLMI